MVHIQSMANFTHAGHHDSRRQTYFMDIITLYHAPGKATPQHLVSQNRPAQYKPQQAENE
jgi:hypothetical protein